MAYFCISPAPVTRCPSSCSLAACPALGHPRLYPLCCLSIYIPFFLLSFLHKISSFCLTISFLVLWQTYIHIQTHNTILNTDATYKRKYSVFVFFNLVYFAWHMCSNCIHFSANVMILSFFMAAQNSIVYMNHIFWSFLCWWMYRLAPFSGCYE